MKKFLIITYIFFITFNFNITNAFESGDLVNFYIDGYTDRSNIYNIPEWQDLLLTKILVFNWTSTGSLSIRDNWSETLLKVNWSEIEYKDIFLKINSSLEVLQSDLNSSYTIFGVIVAEGKDIDYIMSWTEEKKDHFTQEQIATLFQFQVVSVLIIWVFIFYNKIK